jgi:hypothetical protein
VVRVSALVLLVLGVAIADAEPKREVRIETDPPGALVYYETVENGPICDATPCTVELPVGEQSLVIELKGHARIYEAVVVPRRGKIKVPTFKLEKSLGTIVVDGPRGARVIVDDADQGKAPVRADVSAEAHHVVLTLGGKVLYDDYVEVKANEETSVTPTRVASKPDDDREEDDDREDRDGDDREQREVEVAARVTPARHRPSYLRIAAVFDVGFRQFHYAGSQTGGTLRDATQSGQWIGGVQAEVWPGVIGGIGGLRGLSLLGRAQFGLHSQEVVGPNITKLTTFWQSLEISARQRWTFGKLGVEAGAGFVRDQHRYEGFTADIDRAPDVDYQAIRVGARLSAALGRLEPYLGIENRFVLVGGKLEARFDDASINGIRAVAGLAASFGKLDARVQGSLTRYRWDFAFMPTAAYRAESATDSIEQVQLSIGYRY